MTVPSTTRRAGPFTGTGALTSYPFTFKVFAKEDLAVTVADEDGLESTLVLDSSFLVTLNGDQETTPGGSVQYAVSGIATALPAGYSLAITGEGLEYEQTADLPQGGNFNPVVIENALDRQMMLTQLLRDTITRALQLSLTTPAGVDATLPTPVANNFIGWDSGGVGLRNIDPNTLATIVAFASWQSETFNGTGAQTQFTLAADPGSIANTDVSVGGVTQRPNIDYTLSGLVVTFTVAPYSGTNNVLVRYGQALPEGTSTLETALASTASAADGIALLGANHALSYATGTFGAWYNTRVTVKDRPYLATGDGTTNDAAAISAATTAYSHVRFPPGVYAIDQDYTLPRGCTWSFEPGARVHVKAGRTLTILGNIEASEDQWIFSCADTPTNYSDPNNYLGGGAVTTTTPVVLGGTFYAAGGFSGAVSVKWFGATGAGYVNPAGLSAYEGDATIPSDEFTNDTAAIRFALTAICGDYEWIDIVGSQRGATGLFFPDGLYLVDDELYFGGIALYGRTGQSPILGTKILQTNSNKHLFVVQSAGRGGLGGGGSSIQLDGLTLGYRFSSVASTKYVVKFVENKFNLDSYVRRCRFSNCTNGGAVFGWDKKEARAASSSNISGGTEEYGYGTAEGLFVVFHVVNCMFDVGFRVFDVGTYGSGHIEVSDSLFFDYRIGLLYDPAKDLTAGRADNGGIVKLWMRGCSFQDIGQFYAGSDGTQPDQNFLYSRNTAANYWFDGCKYLPEAQAQRGGPINMGGGSLKFTSNDWDMSPFGTNEDDAIFFKLFGSMGDVRISDNQIKHNVASAGAAAYVDSTFAPQSFVFRDNDCTVHAATAYWLFANNPSATIPGAALMTGNTFGAAATRAIEGSLNPNLVVEANTFVTPQNPFCISLQNYGMIGRTVTYGTAAPSSGAHYRGDRHINSAPSVGQPKAWTCTVSGTPGTWVSEGNL